jgi:hypothetical protein
VGFPKYSILDVTCNIGVRFDFNIGVDFDVDVGINAGTGISDLFFLHVVGSWTGGLRLGVGGAAAHVRVMA